MTDVRRLVLAAVLAAALASQACAVTWFTINGQTSGTITTPGSLVLRANTASAGNFLRLIVGTDSNENGAIDPGEPIVANEAYGDGAFHDEDGSASVMQHTLYLIERMSAHYVIRILDENASLVEQAFDFIGTAQGQSISGALRDQNGAPLPGVMVEVKPLSGSTQESIAFTDSAGSFSLSLPAGRYQLSVAYPGFRVPEIYRVNLPASQSVSAVNFVVDTSPLSNTISGTVRDSLAAPMPGAEVVATGAFDAWVFTDINGDYTLRVPAGTWEVFPAEMPQGYYWTGSSSWVSVPPNRASLDFTALSTSYYIWGTVRNTGSSPLPGAEIDAWTGFSNAWAAANQQGKYVCFLPPGTWDVSAGAEGYSLPSSDVESVTVPPQPTLPVDFTLTANSITVSGQVYRVTGGGPVAYALVQPTSITPPWQMNWDIGTRTDASGNYVLHLPPGIYDISAGSELLGQFGSVESVDATYNRTGINIPLPAGNNSPVLSDGSVSPPSGPAGTTFTFQVTYTDSDNDAPAQVYVVIDGWPRAMVPVNPGDTDYTNGADFFVDVSNLAVGSHLSWFGALEEGVLSGPDFNFGYDVRLPAGGTYPGPSVSNPGDPTVAITSPANGATVEGQVTVTATASDPDGVQKVEFYDGATLKFTDTSAPYQWSWDTVPVSVVEGAHNISAKAYDNTAHTAQASIQVTVDNTTFDDVPKTSSQWPYVEALVREGITTGCSTTPPLYCPLSSVTRAQMAVFIVRAMGQTPYNKPTPTFTDVPSGHWAYGYIERMYALGITGGCSTNPLRYCPDSSITRAQMSVFIIRAISQTPYNNPTPTFADVPSGHWAYGYIEKMYQLGITGGCATGPLRYCPDSPVTRSQMAVFIVRAFNIPL